MTALTRRPGRRAYGTDDAPPDHWHDRVAVERAVAGQDVGRPLSEAEISAAACQLAALGHTAEPIARWLHVRTERVLHALAGPAHLPK